MSDKELLAKIGIKDETFEFLTVVQLVKRGIIEKPLDGNHGEIHPKGEDFVASGIPFIMASDINDGIVDYSGCKFITRKQADSLRKGFARNGDVLLTHKATIGRTAIVKYDDQPYVMLTPQVTYYRVSDHQKLNHRYLRYYFESSFFQDILSLWAGSGSTRAYLGITEQGKLPFVLPPINKQKKIAAALTSFDELIENNQRRIALLEKMAEEIYREWFVRLRFPGHEKVKFVKGVPADWRPMLIGDLINRIPPGKKYEQKTASVTGIIPILDQGQSGIIGYHDNEPGVFASPEKPVIVFANHTCYQRLIFCSFSAIQNVLPFVPSATNKSNIYWLHMATNGAVELSEYKGHWPAFTTKRIFYPGFELTQLFGDIAAPLFKQKFQIEKANEVLMKSRDLLLPRLISGKLSVENLDIQFPPGMEEPAHEH